MNVNPAKEPSKPCQQNPEAQDALGSWGSPLLNPLHQNPTDPLGLKTLYLADQEGLLYNGTQLHSRWAYLNFGILGPSVVSWRGPCDIPFEHMIDGEDLLQGAKICGSDMLHFILEVFREDLLHGVLWQRLFANIVRESWESFLFESRESGNRGEGLRRCGDDLYWGSQKMSISIATLSPLSVMVHFAVNISTEGTPVPTIGLKDWELDPHAFAQDCMRRLQEEYASIYQATFKVKPIS